MKKIIKFLLGEALVKALIISVANTLLARFTAWTLKKLYKRFGHLVIYSELSNFLTDLSIEDFLKENDDELTRIAKNV